MVKDKKAQIAELQNLIIPLVGIGIVLVIGFLILAEVRDQSDTVENSNIVGCNKTYNLNCSYAVNGTTAVMGALDDIPGWLPIIVITVIGAILIGLVSVFRGRR